jgi:hypothetical protein
LEKIGIFPQNLFPGLPDGIFSNQKNHNFGKSWWALELKRLGVLNGHLEYITVIWYILWSFGQFGMFAPVFGIVCQEKSGNPGKNISLEIPWKKNLRKIGSGFMYQLSKQRVGMPVKSVFQKPEHRFEHQQTFVPVGPMLRL